jgi:hypothetical protein
MLLPVTSILAWLAAIALLAVSKAKNVGLIILFPQFSSMFFLNIFFSVFFQC